MCNRVRVTAYESSRKDGSTRRCVCVFEIETKQGKGQMFVPGLVSFSLIPAHCASQDLQLCCFFRSREPSTRVTPAYSHHTLGSFLPDWSCIYSSGCKSACILF